MDKDKSQEIITVIASVSQEIGKKQAIQERLCLRDIVALTASEPKPQRIAQSIYADVDFGAEAASATSQGLDSLSTSFFEAPAAHGCARITLLSSITFSISASLAKWLNICSHIPVSHQRAKRLYTLFHLPYSAGNKRHCAPLRLTHSTASMKRRVFRADPTFTCEQLRRYSFIFFHSASLSLIDFMRLNYPSFVNRT